MHPLRQLILSRGTGSGGILLGAGWLALGASNREPPRMTKISDLPVYDEQPPTGKQAYYVEPEPAPFLEQQISVARKAVSSVLPEGSGKVRDRISDIYETGKAHSQSTLDMLRDDTKVLPRAFVITAGGLLGFLAAYRRGMFRKLLYTSLGLGAGATICYPRASRDVVNAGFMQMKDLLKGFEKPKVPSSSAPLQSREDLKVEGKEKKSH